MDVTFSDIREEEKSVFLPLTSLLNDPYLFLFFRNVQSPTEAFEPVRHQPIRRAEPTNHAFFGNITKNCRESYKN